MSWLCSRFFVITKHPHPPRIYL